MDITNPSLAQIQQMLQSCVGKKIWGVLTSIADFSLEIGETWKNPERNRLCGEFGLFISCYWEIRRGDNVVIDSGMEHTKDWISQAESLLEGKTIYTLSFNREDHRLLIVTEMGDVLLVRPEGPKDEFSVWTLFYLVPPTTQRWCTFDGIQIKYDD